MSVIMNRSNRNDPEFAVRAAADPRGGTLVHKLRLSVIVLAALMLLLGAGFGVSAAVPTVAASVLADGSGVTVSFSISDNPGLCSWRFSIAYDKAVLKPASASRGAALQQGSFLDNGDKADGQWNLMWVSASNFTGNGVIATASFTVIGSVSGGNYPLSVTCSADDFVNEKLETAPISTGGVLTLSVPQNTASSVPSSAPTASAAASAASQTPSMPAAGSQELTVSAAPASDDTSSRALPVVSPNSTVYVPPVISSETAGTETTDETPFSLPEYLSEWAASADNPETVYSGQAGIGGSQNVSAAPTSGKTAGVDTVLIILIAVVAAAIVVMLVLYFIKKRSRRSGDGNQ